MRIALVIPAWIPEEIFSARTSGSQINYWQPLGTLYVAAALIEAGHEVIFLNGAFMSHDRIIGDIIAFKPRAVGLYSTTFGWDKAMTTAQAIKDVCSSTHVFVGGPYPIALGADCLCDPGSMAIDSIVTGEGEVTSVELAARLAEGASAFEGVLGLAWRRGTRIMDNGRRPLVEDMDSIAFPARHLLADAGRYVPPPATYRRWPVAVITTSRGCNRRCLYCFQIDRERSLGIRYRSVENVMREIELCLSQGYREIKFIDDTLAADYGRAMRLCHEIKRRRLDFTWFASACVNQVDEPLLKAFKEAGCWAVLFGAESGVQKNLNAIHKGITTDQITKAVRAAQSVGLKVITPFLFGIPGETYEEGLKTIDFAIKLNPDIANFHAITPFPGTDLYDNVDKYGTVSEDLSDYTYQGAAFIPYTMTRQQIAELRQIAFRRFYSRPSFLIKRMLALRTLNDLKAAFNGLRSLFWIWVGKGIFNRKRQGDEGGWGDE